MIIRVKDTIKKRNKDGKYDEQLIDRCVIFGQKYKFEEHVSKKGNSYAVLTLVEERMYYHISIFDKDLIDVIKNDIGKDEMMIAICNYNLVHNEYRNCDEEKYIMTNYMSNRRILLDPNQSVPVRKIPSMEEEKELDFNGDDTEFDLPF